MWVSNTVQITIQKTTYNKFYAHNSFSCVFWLLCWFVGKSAFLKGKDRLIFPSGPIHTLVSLAGRSTLPTGYQDPWSMMRTNVGPDWSGHGWLGLLLPLVGMTMKRKRTRRRRMIPAARPLAQLRKPSYNPTDMAKEPSFKGIVATESTLTTGPPWPSPDLLEWVVHWLLGVNLVTVSAWFIRNYDKKTNKENVKGTQKEG